MKFFLCFIVTEKKKRTFYIDNATIFTHMKRVGGDKEKEGCDVM